MGWVEDLKFKGYLIDFTKTPYLHRNQDYPEGHKVYTVLPEGFGVRPVVMADDYSPGPKFPDPETSSSSTPGLDARLVCSGTVG